ncbi:hypothetical protein [Oceanispirochaeta sp.]|nr:hypothetical protein [Oceanispirochaeta sp.]MDA3958294.1 hypothetical protein [Oceanispirochaeta sp.]
MIDQEKPDAVIACANNWDSFVITLKMQNRMVGTLTFSEHP